MSLIYLTPDLNELESIEISDELNKVIFHIKHNHSNSSQQSEYNIREESRRKRGKVKASVSPSLPEIGCLCSSYNEISVSGLKDFSVMHPANLRHIQEVLKTTDELHALELILIKAKNSGLINQALYTQIRIDVRHRVQEIRACNELKKQNYETLKAEFLSRNALNTTFTRINQASDARQFRGKFVAYRANTYYYVGENYIQHPQDNNIHFAKINTDGDSMDPFMSPHACCSNHALVNEKIADDNSLSMRTATLDELQFLLKVQELEQGRFNYTSVERGLEWLETAIEAIAPSCHSAYVSFNPTFFSNSSSTSEEQLPSATAIAIPDTEPFAICTDGIVDWDTAGEISDSIKEPKPSKVYLVTGGTKAQREEKCSQLFRQEAMAMYSSFPSEDESELAVVFAYDHDTFSLMNFDTAKAFAGNKSLGKDFRTNTFGNGERFGIINLGPTIEESASLSSTFGW